MVFRDIALSRLTGARVHLQHLSTAGSVELVRAAKARGLSVTAEAEELMVFRDLALSRLTGARVHLQHLSTAGSVEPVRAAKSRGLADGTIDAVATDHAPHPQEDKEAPFDQAPCGMLGLETALALGITELVEPGVVTLTELLALMSWRPAAIARIDEIHGGPLEPGAPAHLVVFDPNEEWTVDPDRLASLSRNSPYAGRTVRGRVRHTLLCGEPTVRDGEATR
jgi:dihydroorotase